MLNSRAALIRKSVNRNVGHSVCTSSAVGQVVGVLEETSLVGLMATRRHQCDRRPSHCVAIRTVMCDSTLLRFRPWLTCGCRIMPPLPSPELLTYGLLIPHPLSARVAAWRDRGHRGLSFSSSLEADLDVQRRVAVILPRRLLKPQAPTACASGAYRFMLQSRGSSPWLISLQARA